MNITLNNTIVLLVFALCLALPYLLTMAIESMSGNKRVREMAERHGAPETESLREIRQRSSERMNAGVFYMWANIGVTTSMFFFVLATFTIAYVGGALEWLIDRLEGDDEPASS